VTRSPKREFGSRTPSHPYILHTPLLPKSPIKRWQDIRRAFEQSEQSKRTTQEWHQHQQHSLSTSSCYSLETHPLGNQASCYAFLTSNGCQRTRVVRQSGSTFGCVYSARSLAATWLGCPCLGCFKDHVHPAS
jgi:hypothetical protein